EWGANIKVVSQINRRALSYAAGKAVQMLVYKASEAGIPCDVITDDAPDLAIGGKLVAAGKTLRELKRALKEKERQIRKISKELAALDAVIEGASALASEALQRKADLKQGKLASEAYGRVNNAIRLRLESRLNQGRIVEVEAKLIEGYQRKMLEK